MMMMMMVNRWTRCMRLNRDDHAVVIVLMVLLRFELTETRAEKQGNMYALICNRLYVGLACSANQNWTYLLEAILDHTDSKCIKDYLAKDREMLGVIHCQIDWMAYALVYNIELMDGSDEDLVGRVVCDVLNELDIATEVSID